MTAETDLLPLPEPDYLMPQGQGWPDIPAWSENTVRQIVAHHTAPLQAEIEALRAEVERVTSWNERVSVCRDHVADIVDGPCVICALDAAKARADKLAEALRHQRWCRTCAEDGWESCEEGRKNDALLRDQEEGR
jgi:hypothetical protein